MTESRAERLIEKLDRGRRKTNEVFGALTPEQWQLTIYPEPPWHVRDLLAHFVSAEAQLLALSRSITGGGPGASPDLDIDRYNASEQRRLEGQSPQTLLGSLDQARRETIEWVSTLQADQLDRVGRHPVLGDINVETMIEAIYGHQLLHMRDLLRLLQSVV